MSRTSCFTIILLTLFFVGCSEDVQRTDIQKADKSNALETSVSISPEDATTQTVIYLKAGNTLISEGEIRWYVNDISNESQSGIRFIPDKLTKGDYIKAVIVRNNKEFHSNVISLKNTPPVMGNSNILPERPKVNSTLTAQVKATDVDNDIVTFSYKWTLNGKFAGEDSFLEAEFKRGDLIAVTVTPFDRDDSGKGIRLSTKIYNALPVLSETEPSFDGKHYKYQMNATDPDNDMLTYKLRKGPNGMDLDSNTGLVTWEVKPEDEGLHDVEVSITDSNGGEIIIPFTTRIKL
jgi:hypothetical protein